MAERKGGKWIEPETRWAIYARDGFRCAYCAQPVVGGLHASVPNSAGLDHLLPHSHGGHNRPSNLVTVCGACNSLRGNKTVADFAAALAPADGRTAAQIEAQALRQAGLDLTAFRPAGKALYQSYRASKGAAEEVA